MPDIRIGDHPVCFLRNDDYNKSQFEAKFSKAHGMTNGQSFPDNVGTVAAQCDLTQCCTKLDNRKDEHMLLTKD